MRFARFTGTKLKLKLQIMFLQSSPSTEIDLLDESDEEKEAKKDLLLSCVQHCKSIQSIYILF